jgi:lipoyl(octanoyl) transferase
MKSACHVYRLGLVDYEAAWELQDRLARAIAIGDQPPTLLLLEHPHTFTFGRRGKIENLLWDEAELQRRGVSVHWVDRGGDVTYHGPGQLVGYPLLPLGSPGASVDPVSNATRLPQADFVGYLRRLENVLIAALDSLGVTSFQVPGLTGVWVQSPGTVAQPQSLPAKLAAIGVKVDVRGISRHGFALNVNPDMTYWEGIIGCGLTGYPVASLADLLDPLPSMEQVIQAVSIAFGKEFGYEICFQQSAPDGHFSTLLFDTVVKNQ